MEAGRPSTKVYHEPPVTSPPSFQYGLLTWCFLLKNMNFGVLTLWAESLALTFTSCGRLDKILQLPDL